MHIMHNIFYSVRNSLPRLPHYENVRWFRRPRKPFWLGIAPSKKFVVKEPKQLPKIESDELERLNYAYERQFRSLMKYMSGTGTLESLDERNREIENSIARSLKENDAWNLKSSILREEREKREIERMENIEMENFEKLNKAEEMKKLEIDKIIDEEMELSKTLVNEENLDQSIDNCLENVVDYNYAIDLKGNIYKGNSNVPEGKLISVKAQRQ